MNGMQYRRERETEEREGKLEHTEYMLYAVYICYIHRQNCGDIGQLFLVFDTAGLISLAFQPPQHLAEKRAQCEEDPQQ